MPVERTASFSECGRYRYALERRWSEGLRVLFVMFNPSTANHVEDDPTIRRCINFATGWGFGALMVANLFAFCTPYPVELFAAQEPVGADNDRWLDELSRTSELTVAAWGNNGSYRGRYAEVMPRLLAPHYLIRTAAGQPGHPGRLRRDLQPTRF
jgi:hypothetical protein